MEIKDIRNIEIIVCPCCGKKVLITRVTATDATGSDYTKVEVVKA